jgi:hypothetical protein
MALNLVMACSRPERGKSTGTIVACLSPWQAYRRRASNIGRLTATWWSFKACGTRSVGGKLRWAYLSRPWSKAYDGQPLAWFTAKIFLPWSAIRAPVSTNHLAGVNPGAGVTGGKVHCTRDLLQFIVLSGHHSDHLMELFAGHLSLISM